MRDSSFPSLANFKKGIDVKEEKKRYKLQTAYMIKEFLCQCQSLKELLLKSNKIGDEGMTVIAEAFLGS